MSSNSNKGRAFAAQVREYLVRQGEGVQPEYKIEVGNNSRFTKGRRFDLGNASLLVECKSYGWTKGNNSPAAKCSTANEALLYFMAAPRSYRKMLFLARTPQRDGRHPETLAEYYVRTYRHLFPDSLEVLELDQISLSAKRLWSSIDGLPEPTSRGTAAPTAELEANQHNAADAGFHLTLHPPY